jgi:hypothetical protein
MKVTDFLAEFYPDEAEPIWLRTFDAKGLPKGTHGYVQKIETCRAELATDRALQNKLKGINQKQGIYFVVNAGGNADTDIDRINAIFCEMDDKTIEEQHDILDHTSPWNTSFRVETRKSVHAYWLLKEPISSQDFLNLQQGLISFFKSDVSIKNLSRVMRVPFFNHVRYDDGYKYQPVTINMHQPFRYSLAELKEGFPYAPPPRVPLQWEPTSGRMETLEDVKVELRRRIMEMDSWTTSGRWGCANGKCHNGEGDTGLRIDLISGAVTCWSDCSLKEILAAFGLELPKTENRKFEYLPRREQKSALYQWYQGRKVNG